MIKKVSIWSPTARPLSSWRRQRLVRVNNFLIPYAITSREISKSHSDRMVTALKLLPENVASLLSSKNNTVLICKKLRDVFRYLPPEWEFSVGIHDPSNHTIGVAEEYLDMFSRKVVKDEAPEKSIYHEIGHAFDFESGRVSEEGKFMELIKLDAYDSAHINEKGRFIVQTMGPKEIWAEIFADIMLIRNSYIKQSELLATFPLVARFIEDLIDKRPSKEHDRMTKQLVAC